MAFTGIVFEKPNSKGAWIFALIAIAVIVGVLIYFSETGFDAQVVNVYNFIFWIFFIFFWGFCAWLLIKWIWNKISSHTS